MHEHQVEPWSHTSSSNAGHGPRPPSAAPGGTLGAQLTTTTIYMLSVVFFGGVEFHCGALDVRNPSCGHEHRFGISKSRAEALPQDNFEKHVFLSHVPMKPKK